MNRTFLSLFLVATFPIAVGCSSNDDGTSTPDASADTSVKTDSSTTPVADSAVPPAEDSGNTTADSGNEPNDAGGDVGSGNQGDAGPALSFNTDVWTPIISKHCIGCHGPTADGGAGSGIAFGHLDMGTDPNAYTNLVGTGTGVAASGTPCATAGGQGLLRVAPGNADKSLLYNKLASNDGDGGILLLADGGPSVFCGNPMPLHGHALVPTDLATVHDWIDQGAKP